MRVKTVTFYGGGGDKSESEWIISRFQMLSSKVKVCVHHLWIHSSCISCTII